jgi:hypothetical protein
LRADVTTMAPSAPLPMNTVWRTIRGYVLWQYERGTLHYDIMVTLILIFIFFSPRVINFNDKPIGRNPHPTDVTVTADLQGNLLGLCVGGFAGQRPFRARAIAAHHRTDFRRGFDCELRTGCRPQRDRAGVQGSG